MMNFGGISSEKEAANFLLLDKIGEPYITRYVNHVSGYPNARRAPYSIVPDIHAHNFPTGRQSVNDSGATSSGEAIFEIKTYTACPSRYAHNNNTIALLIVVLKKSLKNIEGSSRSLMRSLLVMLLGMETTI